MSQTRSRLASRTLLIGLVLLSGVLLAAGALSFARFSSHRALAAPIPPPEGYPKFTQSLMQVSPGLVFPVGATLSYRIEIVNTGAYAASDVTLTNPIPANTVYNNDAASSSGALSYAAGILTWSGTVGFDSSVVISYSVDVDTLYEGVISNTAEISHTSLAAPILVSVDAMVTDDPLFEIEKTSQPAIPGPDKPMTYTVTITNRGQPADDLQVTVSDQLPLNTSFISAPPDGTYNSGNRTVTWNRQIDIGTGGSEQFTFSVQVGDVPSGTVLYNANYQVTSAASGIAVGEVYTTTVLDPILFLYKETDPFPPGSNREMVYTLKVLNKGSLATNLVISDTLPSGDLTYVSGGTLVGNTVVWTLPSLDTGESAEVSFTVFIGDVAEVPILNDVYEVCSAEGVCQAGIPLTSIVKGPTFVTHAFLDPIAKKPGGGGGPVTPTLTIENTGPGYALDATATLYFHRISVSSNDLLVIPTNFWSYLGSQGCGSNCVAYRFTGDLDVGEVVTFTTDGGQNTIGGEEGTIYTATVVVSDTLGVFSSEPVTATATGKVTHFANLIPEKNALPVIGPGQTMAYTIQVFNSGLSTDVPPYPILTDSVPVSTTVVSISDGGQSLVVSGTTIVSWTLPAMGPGDLLSRNYSVQVDDDLVSGTLIVNDDYRTSWFDIGAAGATFTLSNTGQAVTTVVKEVGLIDSYKLVTPTLASPAPDNHLTYVVHVANTSPVALTGVKVYDVFPWQVSTYQRDAVVIDGVLISDIVSLDWTGDVGAYSEKLITFTVAVDPYYQGPVTNTATISHTDLLNEVVVDAVAYITEHPVLRISKTASPDPVRTGNELLYTIRVVNLGQQATELLVSDTIPANTTFVPYSASGNGQLVGDQVQWGFPVLEAGAEQLLTFSVKVRGLEDIVNADYMVTCVEGVTDFGEALITSITGFYKEMLPLVYRNY